MSKFYGQVSGQAETTATRRGSKDIKVSAQSWDGSIQTRLYYNDKDELMVDLTYSDGSDFYGYRLFYGTFKELLKKFGVEVKNNG